MGLKQLDKMEFSISIFSSQSEDTIRKIFVETHKPYNTNKSVSKFINRVLGSDFKDIKLSYGDSQPINRLFIASINDKVVGCIAVSEIPSKPLQLEIKRLGVLSKYRNKGIATKLIETAENYCKELNKKEIYLTTINTMTEANMLYQKLGYKITKQVTIGHSPNEIQLIDYLKDL